MLNRLTPFSYVIPLTAAHHNASSGAMEVRILHDPSTYNDTHQLQLDYVSFEKVDTNDAMASDIAAIRAKTDQLQFVLSGVVASLESAQQLKLSELHEFLGLKSGAPVTTTTVRQGSDNVAVSIAENAGEITTTRI
jgi:hypothetical protein